MDSIVKQDANTRDAKLVPSSIAYMDFVPLSLPAPLHLD